MKLSTFPLSDGRLQATLQPAIEVHGFSGAKGDGLELTLGLIGASAHAQDALARDENANFDPAIINTINDSSAPFRKLRQVLKLSGVTLTLNPIND